MSLSRKIFSESVLFEAILIIAAFIASALVARHFFKAEFQAHLQRQMDGAAALLLPSVPSKAEFASAPGSRMGVLTKSWCERHAVGTSYRITVMDLAGEILCESRADDGKAPIAFSGGAATDKGVALSVADYEDTTRVAFRIFDVGTSVVVVFLSVALWAFAFVSRQKLEIPESMLDRIQSDLKQNTDALSREREELATLMSAISDAIVAVDLEGKPLFFNSRFALLFFGKESKDRQPHLGEVFRAPEVLDAFRAALEGAHQQASVKLYVKSDPVPRFFSLAIAPLRREVGPVYGAVGIFHDVTELKRAENIRIEFVANVSHELRTPLTAIKGYTDTLQQDLAVKRYDSAEAFLEIIVRNVDRLMRLIVDLLDLSSLESQDSAGKLIKSTVDTRELTSRVLAQLESRRAGKGHKIDTVYGASSVVADPARLEQVLVNLLENSIKYVPDGGRVAVTWEKSLATPGAVLLKVSDNGPGIPVEHHARLFERFYRVDKGRSRDMGGTGLGLAIVKHIMQQHGGSVWVNSEMGRGTEFVCQFPGA